MIDTSKLKVGDRVRIGEPPEGWDGYVFPIGTFTVIEVIMSPGGLASVPMLFRIDGEPRMIRVETIAAIEAA